MLAALLALTATAATAVAQTDLTPAQEHKPRARLDELTEKFRLNEKRAEELRSEVSAIKADRAELTRRLIDTADKIKESEAQIDAAEDRLTKLSGREDELRNSLKARRGELAEILAALQRLGRAPPPALLVKPREALGAIRSAIMLGAVVPELRVAAQKIAGDLETLVALREQIAAEKTALATNAARLAEDRVRIEALIDSKQSSLAATLNEFENARRAADKLAGETRDLKELIARMDAEIAFPDEPADPAVRRAALSDPGRIRPAMSFTEARGLLPMPVSGSVVTGFGEEDGFGGTTRGISIATRPRAQVTSPSDGWVVYAGAFRSYGQLLIINVGGGYHVVLAGLEKTSVELGQFVLAGEPVGVLADGAGRGHTVVARDPADRPVLYVEFRKDGTSIDPAPWWASADEKVRG